MRWQYIIQYNNKASLLSQHQAVTPAFLTSNLRSERQAFSTWLLLILVLMLVLMLVVVLVVVLLMLVLMLVSNRGVIVHDEVPVEKLKRPLRLS